MNQTNIRGTMDDGIPQMQVGADLPEFSFTFFDWRVVSQRPQESTREGVLVKCYYLPIYFSSQMKYHILWIFVVYTQ